MSREVVHFLLHVPKCAGTTVEHHFERHLGKGFLIAPRWENPWRNVVGNRYDYAPGDARLSGVRAVSGHSLSTSLRAAFPGAQIRESVLLRDPVGYHLSLYNYRWTWHRKGHGPQPPDFARWYRAQRRDPIARFLLTRYFEQGVPALYRLSSAGRLAYLEARLAGFWFVGDYRRAGELVAAASRDLGIPETVENRNVTERKEVTADSLGADWVARIAADNPVDAALHARWKDRGWATAAAPEEDASGRASSPTEAARAADGAARAPAAPALPGHDQLRHLLGDMTSGITKKLIR
ncbi:hypothetical protein LNKW23_17250 [Paralimibaculum aggregatum]|uniref:Sulfotransferase family protein n=1 Tax=Paralimibaculum aggregatum TaxID=3036245 RepID=A0ABQ6LHQ3_9RHOB|nr:hypothetical protein [Limibaculum sp. NKW23]GMG82512.1 hypothetical protein LNKW23_17250 [Limibaculum sp. NKW23]